MNSQNLKRKKQLEFMKSLENTLKGNGSGQGPTRVADLKQRSKRAVNTEQAPSMPEQVPVRTKFKNQGPTRMKEPEQDTIRVKVSGSGDPGPGQGLGADFITQEPLSCAHVPSSRARGSASVSSSSSASPVAIHGKEENLDTLSLSEKSLSPSRHAAQRGGSSVKKAEAHSDQKKNTDIYSPCPKLNTGTENCTLAKTFKRRIQNQKKYNYNSKLCDVSIFGTKAQPKTRADISTGSPDYIKSFSISRSPSASQASYVPVKDKPSPSASQASYVPVKDKPSPSASQGSYAHVKDKPSPSSQDNTKKSSKIDVKITEPAEKNCLDNPRSTRVVSAKKIFEPSPATTSVDNDNQLRLKPKMSTAIQSIQERLLKEMEEDASRVKKSYDSTKVYKVQAPRPKCTWTPGMLAGVARKRSRSRYSGAARRASRYISPNKRERPYRQWLGMSTCVTRDTKFIIASVQPTPEGVAKEAPGATNTCSVGTQHESGRSVKSRDGSSRERMVGRDCGLTRRSSARQSPDSHKSLPNNKEVPILSVHTGRSNIVKPDSNLVNKLNTIQSPEGGVTEIPEELQESISCDSGPSLHELNDFKLKEMEIYDLGLVETTRLKNHYPNEALDPGQVDELVDEAENVKMNSTNMTRREPTNYPVVESYSREGGDNIKTSPGLSREADGDIKSEHDFRVYDENLTGDAMCDAIEITTRSRMVETGDNFNATRMESSPENNQVTVKEQETDNLEQENITTPAEDLADNEVTEPLREDLNTHRVDADRNLSTENNELTLKTSRSKHDFPCESFPIENGSGSKTAGGAHNLENIPSTHECTVPTISVSESRNEGEISNEEESVNEPLEVEEISDSSCSCPLPNHALDNSTLSATNQTHFKLVQQDTDIQHNPATLQSTASAACEIQADPLNSHKRLYGHSGEINYPVKQKETESLSQQPFLKPSPKVVTFLSDKPHEDSFISANIAHCPVSGDKVFHTTASERCPAPQSIGGRSKSQLIGDEINLIPSSTGTIHSLLSSPRAFSSARPKQFFRMNDNKATRFCDRGEELHRSKQDGKDKPRAHVTRANDPKSPKVTVDPANIGSSKHHKNSKYKYVQAIADFQGVLPGQLSFNKGQIIRQRCVHDVCGMRYGSYRVGRLKMKRKGLYPASCVTDFPPSDQQLI
ncbi:unnamed protein product [Lymnaea stagnalis]|uniref:SH3 domain-containing protein n=1 Tax=Lymnaea stagnalis TaxID=6523 RepID=A0AAV2I0P1_LYMST